MLTLTERQQLDPSLPAHSLPWPHRPTFSDWINDELMQWKHDAGGTLADCYEEHGDDCDKKMGAPVPQSAYDTRHNN